ncbi:MAG: hypothetical protein N2039_05395 [Gemmataceae bacterium]|nr:hypothetical protein [Gemmataceae bacterium]
MDAREDAILLAALKEAVAAGDERRLYRSGKLSGLFPSKAGVSGAAAARALRDGLLEVVRVENRGKVSIDWVRITPAGVEYLYRSESPIVVLRELRQALAATQSSLPRFLEDLHQEWQRTLNEFRARLDETQRKLHVLAARVEETVRRIDTNRGGVADALLASTPWASEAVDYLERRKESGGADGCPLPELFTALRRRFPELNLIDFHSGLRRLHDHRAIVLRPFDGPTDKIPEPEYALLDGAELMYFAAR